RADLLRPAVLLRDDGVVLERLVRGHERVGQLVAPEDVVVAPRLVARAVLRVDRPAHGPQRAGKPLDPDHHPLRLAPVVDAVDLALGEPGGRSLSHGRTVTRIPPLARLSSFLRNPFSFLFARSGKGERVAAYVIREHRRGRPLVEILEDPYIRNRCTDREVARRLEPRLLDRVAAHERRALEDDVVELAATRIVGADRADECARPQPLAAEDRVAGGRGGDHHVLLGGIAVALARLGSDLGAELTQPRLAAAVGNYLLDPGQRLPDAGDLAARLPATADHAQRGS